MNKKRWLISAIISLLITGAVFLWGLFFEWGIPYFLYHFSFAGMILPLIIGFIVFTLLIRVLIFSIARTVYLHRGARGGTHIDVTVVDGIANIPQGMVVTLELEKSELTIKSQVTGAVARLPYTQIKEVGKFTSQEIKEKSKSIAGRAVIGGLLLGSVGAIVGGMTGLGTKSETVQHDFLIINYMSQNEEEKVLSFSVNYNITWGLTKFMDNLKEQAGMKPAVAPVPYEAPAKDITL